MTEGYALIRKFQTVDLEEDRLGTKHILVQYDDYREFLDEYRQGEYREKKKFDYYGLAEGQLGFMRCDECRTKIDVGEPFYCRATSVDDISTERHPMYCRDCQRENLRTKHVARKL